jgi:hypothetical protein
MKLRAPSASRGRLGLAATLLLGCLNTATISAAPDVGAPVGGPPGADAGAADGTAAPEERPALDAGAAAQDQGPAPVDGESRVDDVVAVDRPVRDVGLVPVDVVAVDRPARDAGRISDALQSDDNGIPTPPSIPTCGGVRCAAGEACCFGTGRCYDPATPAACPMPSRAADPRACASNEQCDPTELCVSTSPSSLCVGVGTCEARRELRACGLGTEVCGCDGQFWPSSCAASLAGVRGEWHAACGQQVYPSPGAFECAAPDECPPGYACDIATRRCVATHPLIACGNDSQCPSGQFCCLNTGLCVSSSDRDLCRTFLPGGFVGCRSNADCVPLQGFLGSALFCAGDGCGTVGTCLRVARECSGEFAPVCGCDGRSYTNPCSAAAAATRVAHTGSCS